MFLRPIKRVILLVMPFLVFFLLLGQTRAADKNVDGVIISPPIAEKEVSLNTEINGKIKVTNPNTTTALKITVSVSDFKADGEEGNQTFIEPESNTTFALGAWINIEKEFTLSANETKEIPYTVKIPANAEPGGHYGVIFFSPSSVTESSISGSGVSAIPKVGSLLLFTVPGDIKYAGNIAEFKTDKSLYLNSSNKIDVITRFENLSTNHVKPQGIIVIKNLFGKEVDTLSVNEKMGNVLPDSIRRFENSWEKEYGFGLYKANVVLAYGNSGSTSADLSFWIVPWRETAGAVIILIILIWIISHLRWRGRDKEQPIDFNNANKPPIASSEPPVQNTTLSIPPTNQASPSEPVSDQTASSQS